MFGLAIFSKESAITYLAIFPLAAYFFGNEKSLFESIKPSLLFLIPTVIYLIVRSQIIGGQIGLDNTSPLDSIVIAQSTNIGKFAMAVCMAGYYLKSMFLPYPLVSDIGYNEVIISGLGDWKVLLSAALYLGMFYFVFRGWRERKLSAFGILFFLITFSISSNIFIKIGTGYGERLMYVPSFGLLVALIGFLIENGKIERIKLIGISAIVAIFALISFGRNKDWKDSFTLYEADVTKSPNCAKLNYHYALELTKKGRDAKNNKMLSTAIEHFDKAISIYPNYSDAYGEKGLAYFYQGNQEKALENYQKAIAIKPEAKVWSNMGMIYFNTGNMAEAQKVYEKSVALDPAFVDARRNLGAAYAMQKMFPQAIEQFKEAIKYAPDQAVLYFFLGSAYKDSGDAVTGEKFLAKAYAMQPSLKK